MSARSFCNDSQIILVKKKERGYKELHKECEGGEGGTVVGVGGA